MSDLSKLHGALRRGRVRTPTVIQMESVECGAAALAIVLGYHGRIVPLPELRRICGVSRDGSKASNILKAAKHYGFRAKGFKKEIHELGTLSYPYIVYWNFNHFLVVEGGRHDHVYLNDPATGPRTVPLEEFDEGYTGVVLVMEPGPEFQKEGRKKNVLVGLADWVHGSIPGLLFGSIASLLLALPALAAAGLMQAFIDNLMVRGVRDWAAAIVLGLVATAVIKALISALQLRVLRQLRIKLAVTMTTRFFWHLLRLPASFYLQRYSGEISSRLALNDKIAGAMSGRLATAVMSVFMIVIYGVVMFRLDSLLTAIAVVFALSNFVYLHWTSRKRVDGNYKLIADYGKLSAASISGLRSMWTIKASGLESAFFTRWSGHFARVTNAQQTFALSNQILNLIPLFLTAIMSTLILVVGGLRVIEGTLTIGMLVAFQSIASHFQTPIQNLMSLGAELQELRGDINRLDDVLQNPALPTVKQPLYAGDLTRLSGSVELRNVSFGYNPTDAPLISGLTLHIKPGQRIAFVGPTGSGKSTVLKLITDINQPTTGEILFDGKRRSEIHPQVMASSLAAVDQELVLFEGTVQENLTLWNTAIPADQISQACRDALIDDSIIALPRGYESELLEGAMNLSGGQRQRLELARALAGNPSILILDEATSALDPETERLVAMNIKRRGCSCILVAHRLSTIRDCDEILVLENGNVVERGDHETLLDSRGLYYRLVVADPTMAGAT